MKKRVLSCIMAVVLLVALVPAAVSANAALPVAPGSGNVNIFMRVPESAAANEVVPVDVYLYSHATNTGDFSLRGMAFNVEFDRARLLPRTVGQNADISLHPLDPDFLMPALTAFAFDPVPPAYTQSFGVGFAIVSPGFYATGIPQNIGNVRMATIYLIAQEAIPNLPAAITLNGVSAHDMDMAGMTLNVMAAPAPAVTPTGLERVGVAARNVAENGGELSLAVNVLPAGANMAGYTVEWESNATANATVAAVGVVDGVASATVTGVLHRAEPVTITARLMRGTTPVATETFTVTVTEEVDALDVVVTATARWGRHEVGVTITNNTGEAVNNAYIVVEVGAPGTQPARVILSGISVADGATESFSTNLFAPNGARASAWVVSTIPATGPTLTNMQLSAYGIGLGPQITVGAAAN